MYTYIRRVHSVNKNRKVAPTPDGAGRVAQRSRTRQAIVEATTKLITAGGSPSIAAIAQAAQVSRRTVYMYFPTVEQLLLDATLGALARRSIDPVLAASTSADPLARIEQLTRAMTRDAIDTLDLGRALVRLTVEGEAPRAGGPRRGYRRVHWIEQALAPARQTLTAREFERLVSALCVLIGWESLIVLNDVRGISPAAADDVLLFAVRAVVEKSLAEAAARRRAKASASPPPQRTRANPRT
jgi:AcrR family transcriptional regulator